MAAGFFDRTTAWLPGWPVVMRPLCCGLALLVVLAAAEVRADSRLETCQVLLNEQWAALWAGNQQGADKLSARARQNRCFQPPIKQQLCPIPSAQELKADLAGDALMVNLARHQQRFLGCSSLDLGGYEGGR